MAEGSGASKHTDARLNACVWRRVGHTRTSVSLDVSFHLMFFFPLIIYFCFRLYICRYLMCTLYMNYSWKILKWCYIMVAKGCPLHKLRFPLWGKQASRDVSQPNMICKDVHHSDVFHEDPLPCFCINTNAISCHLRQQDCHAMWKSKIAEGLRLQPCRVLNLNVHCLKRPCCHQKMDE